MTGAQRIDIPPAADAAMRRHAEETYPYEACGAIYGSGDGSGVPWQATGVEAAPNDHDEDHRVRYLVSPAFQVKAEQRALAAGEDVVGWYHSHPEDLARPSEYDRSHAWVGYVYVIYSVRSGRAVDVNAFTLDEQDGTFQGVAVETSPPALQPET